MGGVIWVLKDGEVYVDESIAAECDETEETGTLDTFASVISARTLVGHDKDGRVMVVHIEGKTYRNGYARYFLSVLNTPIPKTYLYNFDPLKPHFYTVKLVFTGVYIIFFISAQNTDCGYL